MGEIGQGKARKAGIEPTDWINHRMGVSAHGAVPRGCFMPVLQGNHGSPIRVAGIMFLSLA